MEPLDLHFMNDKRSRFQMSKVSVDVKADTSSAVNAPVLTDNTITGPVNIICGSNTAEQQNSTEKLTQEQENMTQLVTVKCRVNETVDLETLTLNNPVECKKGFVESEQHYYHDLLHITLTFVHTSSTVALLEVTSLFKLHQKDPYDTSDEASVNLFHCLLELKDQSLCEKIQKYLHPDDSDSVIELSSSMCTLMIYVLLMSGNVLDEFNMNRYDVEDKERLIPAVRCCRRAL
ncbi:hypothetical protein E1301_Tti021346 [Triplophysa tibetana]|uniref:Uncharacterized protein n=1 Tax=Triplophysa tibetana TaxID=1572043 RepID=A0A5A9PI30_9TELE|nr:hypothetical protein E1301_Tti021346 [Triplophysa tibetana]